jgi:DNA-binding transcriptional regulator YhcF (GntR family)
MSWVTSIDTPALERPSFQTVVGHIAAILLDYPGNCTAGKRCLSQREMASLIGTSWEQVNRSLKYLQKKGAIRIDRHRIIAQETLLRRIAGGRDA